MEEIRISAEQFRRELTELLSQAGYGGATVVIERHGTPLAALIPYQQYMQDHQAQEEQTDKQVREAAIAYDAHPPRVVGNVLTLEEAAAHLRTSTDILKEQAELGEVPGRKLGDSWRFSRTAIEQWLQPQNSRATLLAQAGIFANDPMLETMLETIYQQRGRSQIGPS